MLIAFRRLPPPQSPPVPQSWATWDSSCPLSRSCCLKRETILLGIMFVALEHHAPTDACTIKVSQHRRFSTKNSRTFNYQRSDPLFLSGCVPGKDGLKCSLPALSSAFSLSLWRRSSVKFVYPIEQKANLSKYNLVREDPAQDKTDQPNSSGLTSTHDNRERGDEVRWGEEKGIEDKDLSIPDRELWIEVIQRTVKIKTSSAKKKKKKRKNANRPFDSAAEGNLPKSKD